MSFNEFVREISKIEDFRADQHFRGQISFIKDHKGKTIPDFIGKVERLEKDFKLICKKNEIKNCGNVGKENKTKNRKNYREYYDAETKRLVEERYKQDFELFEYKF